MSEKTKPHVYIHWNNIETCIDLNCECGHVGHYDGAEGEDIRFWRCPDCSRVWAIGDQVALTLASGDIDTTKMIVSRASISSSNTAAIRSDQR